MHILQRVVISLNGVIRLGGIGVKESEREKKENFKTKAAQWQSRAIGGAIGDPNLGQRARRMQFVDALQAGGELELSFSGAKKEVGVKRERRPMRRMRTSWMRSSCMRGCVRMHLDAFRKRKKLAGSLINKHTTVNEPFC